MGRLNLFETPIYLINLMDNPIQRALDSINIDEHVSKEHLWSCSVETGFYNKNRLPEDLQSVVLSTLLPHVFEYIRPYKLPTDKPITDISISSMWLNRYDGSSYQEVHAHEGADQIAFNYVYKTYDGAPVFQALDPLKQADKYLKTLNGFSFSPAYYNFELGQHELLLFPTWLYHHVLKGESEGERITLSGNIRIQCEGAVT